MPGCCHWSRQLWSPRGGIEGTEVFSETSRCLHGFLLPVTWVFLSTQEPKSQPASPKTPFLTRHLKIRESGVSCGVCSEFACSCTQLGSSAGECCSSWCTLSIPWDPPVEMLPLGTTGAASPQKPMCPKAGRHPTFVGLCCLQGKASENFHVKSQQHTRGRDPESRSARTESGLLIIYASPPCCGDETDQRHSQITERRLKAVSPERPFIQFR